MLSLFARPASRRHRWDLCLVVPFFVLLVTIPTVSATDADAGTAGASLGDSGFSNLVAWVKSHGGRVDGRVDVRVLEPVGIRGGTATADIRRHDELLFCPWELVLGSGGLDDQMTTGGVRSSDAMCAVVRRVAAEYRAGAASPWRPYLELDDSLTASRLPASWSRPALAELQGLPPAADATRHVRWFAAACDGGAPVGAREEATLRALVSFVTRASAAGMVPVYDLFNHHNGLRNVKLTLAEDGVRLVALEDIPEGNEIYLSYGIKAASTMFRDYGFVEPWPQIWTWTDDGSGDRYSFVLFPGGVVAINPTEVILKEMIGSGSVDGGLERFQERVREHTRNLHHDDLVRFRNASRNLLAGLPTDAVDDGVILGELQNKREEMSSSETRELVHDSIAAVEYRIVFKRAVEQAVVVAEEAIGGSSDDDHSSREL